MRRAASAGGNNLTYLLPSNWSRAHHPLKHLRKFSPMHAPLESCCSPFTDSGEKRSFFTFDRSLLQLWGSQALRDQLRNKLLQALNEWILRGSKLEGKARPKQFAHLSLHLSTLQPESREERTKHPARSIAHVSNRG